MVKAVHLILVTQFEFMNCCWVFNAIYFKKIKIYNNKQLKDKLIQCSNKYNIRKK